MARVTYHENDPFVTYIYSNEETNEIFGEDFLVEYGIEIPDELFERYKICWNEFWKIQNELDKIIYKKGE